MNPIKRFAISLNASLDQFLCQVENHEAVAESSIREVEKSAIKARGQFRRIQINHQRVQKRVEELRAAREQWKDRAKRIHATDEQGALECVRRIKLADHELAQQLEQARQYAELEMQLSGDLRHVDAKLHELRMKHNLLCGKAAKVEAAAAIEKVTNETGTCAEGVFDRWEARIEGQQLGGMGGLAMVDHFEAKLKREEEQAELKQTLVDILGE